MRGLGAVAFVFCIFTAAGCQRQTAQATTTAPNAAPVDAAQAEMDVRPRAETHPSGPSEEPTTPEVPTACDPRRQLVLVIEEWQTPETANRVAEPYHQVSVRAPSGAVTFFYKDASAVSSTDDVVVIDPKEASTRLLSSWYAGGGVNVEAQVRDSKVALTWVGVDEGVANFPKRTLLVPVASGKGAVCVTLERRAKKARDAG